MSGLTKRDDEKEDKTKPEKDEVQAEDIGKFKVNILIEWWCQNII